ncbi:MAG: substrate-binding domain-containing protein [Acidimicrobiales bacterium]
MAVGLTAVVALMFARSGAESGVPGGPTGGATADSEAVRAVPGAGPAPVDALVVDVANSSYAVVMDPVIVEGFTAAAGATPVIQPVTSGPGRLGILAGKPVDVFLADEANVDAVIARSEGGTCEPGPTVAACPGLGPTRTRYATGTLAVVSCSLRWRAGPAGATSPTCRAQPVTAPDGGPPDSITDLVAMLGDSRRYPDFRLALADPALAPFGAAGRSALTVNGGAGPVHGGGPGLSDEGFDDLVASGRIVLVGGVTAARTALTSGTTGVRAALVATSMVARVRWDPPVFVGARPKTLGAVSADPNPWTVIPAPGNYRPVGHYGVVLRRSVPRATRENAGTRILSYLATDASPVLDDYGLATDASRDLDDYGLATE